MWIFITLAAATFQILRTSRQHELRSVLSTAAAGFVRYAYGAPLAVALSLVLFGALGRDLPGVHVDFWPALLIAPILAGLIGAAVERSTLTLIRVTCSASRTAASGLPETCS